MDLKADFEFVASDRIIFGNGAVEKINPVAQSFGQTGTAGVRKRVCSNREN